MAPSSLRRVGELSLEYAGKPSFELDECIDCILLKLASLEDVL
jgi:hypothetical protein